MTSDEAHAPPSEHSVEIVNAVEKAQKRRSRSLKIATAVCATGVLLVGAVAILYTERASDQRTIDGLQKQELRSGWQTLSAVAAQAAEATPALSAQPASSVPEQPVPAPTNIVILNLPTPPHGPSTTDTSSAANGTAALLQMQGANAPTPVPAQGLTHGTNAVYVPVPVTVSGDSVPGQSVSNGTTVGAVPNPALRNGATSPSIPNVAPAGAPATPALPNGTVNVSPPQPTLPNGTVNVSPPQPTLPIGTIPASP